MNLREVRRPATPGARSQRGDRNGIATARTKGWRGNSQRRAQAISAGKSPGIRAHSGFLRGGPLRTLTAVVNDRLPDASDYLLSP